MPVALYASIQIWGVLPSNVIFSNPRHLWYSQLSLAILLSFSYNYDTAAIPNRLPNLVIGGKVIMMNASVSALLDAQKALEGVAESLGVHTEQDVVDMVKEIRKERSGNYRCE